MEDNTTKLSKEQDELDLLNLVEKAVSFFRNFGKIIIIFSITGLLTGALIYAISAKKFASTLILHSSILTNQEEIAIIEFWEDLLQKKEYPTLANIFNCNVELLKKVSNIKASEIQKLYVQNNPNGFTVEVLVEDTAVLDGLQKGIVYGLENSDYVKSRVAIKKNNLYDLIGKVKDEILKMNFTKSNVDSIMTNKGRSSSSLLIDISGINTQWINLNEKLLDYQEKLKLINAVQVLQSFNKLSNPETPKLTRSLFFGFLAGFFMGYIVAIYMYVQLKLKDRKKPV